MNSMRRYGMILAILLIFPLGVTASDMDDLFQEGNRIYQAGDYETALQSYRRILEMGHESGPLYFNMGNCHYKMQEIGRAVLFYERARKLMPGDEDVQANLALANLAVVDKIEPQAEFLLFRIGRGIIHLLPESVLVAVLVGAYLVFIGFLVLWIVARKRLPRLIGSRMSVLFGILFVVLGLCLAGQQRDASQTVEAVIMVGNVDVMSAPGGDGVEVFTLHEGTKVRLDQESGEWVEIVLPDRKVGWVRQEVLEII